MKDNSSYNLALQLVEESKSLWRIENEYIEDAGDDEELRNFWEAMAAEKEARVAELKVLVAERLAAEAAPEEDDEIPA